jgi:hypothetical protein
MIIKKAVYKKKKVLQNTLISDEVYGCDCCRKEIKDYSNEKGRLDMTVFYNENDGGKDTDHYHFCSWNCVLKFIPTVKTGYFLSLSHVMFDEKGIKSAYELIRLLKPITKK